MKRASKVCGAVVGGSLITFGAIFLYWRTGSDPEGCSGEECALEYAAVVIWGMIIGLLVGAACAFVVYILTAGPPQDPS